MPDLRLAAYAAVVAGFAGFAAWGLRGWMGGGTGEPAARPAATPAPAADADEIPLKTGYVKDLNAEHYVAMGYPWIDLRPEMLELKDKLPPDPAPVDTVEAENRNRELLKELRFEMPTGRVLWPKFLEIVKSRIEPHGVPVETGLPYIEENYFVELPAKEWTGMEIFDHVMLATHRHIVFDVTSQGVIVGTDRAVNNARRDAALVGLRRRVAAEHADPALDVEFRPDVLAADMVKFVRGATAQTGVDIALEGSIWDSAYALTWRGHPRTLRDALDELCAGFHFYWRWNGKRVWLLRP
jgi:hypothetical protein